MDAMEERIKQLANVPLFSGLRDKALLLIANVASEEAHPVGTTVFEHGSAGDKLYVILEGKIRISREVAGMGEEALAIMGPGQVFGEMALLDESPRSADARVHERSPSPRTASTICCSWTRSSPTRCSGRLYACWLDACATRPTN